jgi:hypothetical protein
MYIKEVLSQQHKCEEDLQFLDAFVRSNKMPYVPRHAFEISMGTKAKILSMVTKIQKTPSNVDMRIFNIISKMYLQESHL